MSRSPLQCVWLHGLVGSRNSANDVREVLRERRLLRPGMRLDGPSVEFIVGSCTPRAGGLYDEASTEVMFGEKTLNVFQKVHVLPYQDTFKYNYDFMYNDHMVPFFQSKQEGEFTEGFDFAYQGVRFQVVGVLPDKSYGVVGKDTTIFYEGPAIERKVLEKLHLLPFVDGLPERYRPSDLELDDEALLKDLVRPYFEQRSAPVKPNEHIDIEGVNFKIVACRPAAGGGVGPSTELSCKGVALRTAFAPKAKSDVVSKAIAKVKAKAKARAGGPADAAAGGSSGSDGNCVLS